MEVLNTVKVEDVVTSVELNIANFIDADIDEGHFGGIPDEGCFGVYDKERINFCLAKMKKKRLAKVASAGNALFHMVLSLDIKINQSAFYFLAFLRGIHNKSEDALLTIKNAKKQLKKEN